MVKFAQKFVVLFFLVVFIPLLCLLGFHKMNMETAKSAQSKEMLDKISRQFLMSVDDKKLEDILILAPILVEVYDTDGNLTAELNKPPFPVFGDNNFKDVYKDGLKFRFIEIAHPGMDQKGPPLAIPQIVIILSSAILCSLLIWYMNKVFIGPLNEIIKNLEKIKKGNLDVKFVTQSENEEIKRTYETLNEMVFGLIEKEKLRNNFIQNLTHDLRAPIIAQNRALAILQEEFGGHELIGGMKDNNQDYLKMINLILECYKCDEANVPIDKIEFNFSNLTNVIIKALEPLSKEKNIEIINRVEPSNLVIFGDYISMNRVLMNLISNAIECMCVEGEEGKKIEIFAQNFEKYSTITVQDNGCGIKKEELDKIFDKYNSFSNSGNFGTRAVCGLGLCIVKNLIQRNNGEINAESEVGSYTKFTIKLPNKDYQGL